MANFVALPRIRGVRCRDHAVARRGVLPDDQAPANSP